MEFIVFILAAIAVHRIWNYEDIFDGARHFLMAWLPPWPGYVFVCKVCNAFWIGLGVAFLTVIEHWAMKTVLLGLASYPIIRGLVWFYGQEFRLPASVPMPAAIKPAAVTTKEEPKHGCSECEKKKTNLQAEQKRVMAYDKRVVLMTTLANFNASYSLSSCVLDQARALASVNPKWLIQIWVLQVFDDSLWPKDMPANVELRRVIPTVKWENDGYDSKTAGLLAATVQRELITLGNADIITHDILFQRAYLNFAAAIHSIAGTRNFRWWHQAHSGPSPLADRPQLPLLYRYSLPDQGDHHILNLNDAHRDGFMQHYAINNYDRIPTCPNARDPRTLYGASPEISAFVGATGLLDADVVQILPVSTERSFAKGVQHVIKVFGSLKARGLDVRLVIANAHANGNEKFIMALKEVGKEWGLTAKELIFTSDHFPTRLSAGLTSADTQFLFRISNLFVFASTAEASSLVVGEAAAAGCLMALNASVPSLMHDAPQALAYPFGTSNAPEWPTQCPSPDDIAEKLHTLLSNSNTNRTQRNALKTRSLEAIGRRLSEIMA